MNSLGFFSLVILVYLYFRSKISIKSIVKYRFINQGKGSLSLVNSKQFNLHLLYLLVSLFSVEALCFFT